MRKREPLKSPVRKIRTPGSVRGPLGNRRFYRDAGPHPDTAWLDINGLWPIIRDDMPTVVEGDFEWDSIKAESNLAKHGVSFAEAATVFADPIGIYLDDGSGTGNMVVIGTSLRERLLCVVHVERGD